MRHEISYTIGHDRSVAIVAEDEDGEQDGQRLRWLPIDSIDLSVDQPRRVFNEEALDELTDSVRQYGVLQPIRVRMCGERHQVVAGHRRVMAARRAGLDSVPAVVAGSDDNRALIEALIENIQREELNPIDRGEALQRLRVNLGAQSWEEVGRVIGISRRHVYHLLNISALPDPIRADIQAGNVNEKHGRALLRLRDHPELQMNLWRRIVDDSMSGDEAIGVARSLLSDQPQPESPSPLRPRRRSRRDLEGTLLDLLRLLPQATMGEIRPLRSQLEALSHQLADVMTDAFHAEEEDLRTLAVQSR